MRLDMSVCSVVNLRCAGCVWAFSHSAVQEFLTVNPLVEDEPDPFFISIFKNKGGVSELLVPASLCNGISGEK